MRQLDVDELVQHGALLAQPFGQRQQVRLGRRVQLANEGQQLVANPIPHVRVAVIARVVAPAQVVAVAVARSVSARVIPSSGRTMPPPSDAIPSTARRVGEEISR